ncbi:MAG: hypothetical protein RKR03_12190 [Candidatus Competibacter sp.]|nr:hypothetical protein [Candidatus Competibacter sp.]
MASRNVEKQCRPRPSARGLAHGQGWVTPEQAEAIRRIMTERDGNAPHEPLGQQRAPETCFGQNPA